MVLPIKKDLVDMTEEVGVYTLANDAVIEWFQAFVRSFRKTNPTLSLTVIPYDQHISQIRKLKKDFDFEIMDSDVCSKYNVLADKVKVAAKEAGCFRKLASFVGKYRNFLFLDSDIVVLMPLDSLFKAFSESSTQFVYFDTAMDMCYKRDLAAVMIFEYNSPAYNSGAFFSRKELISEKEIFSTAEKAIAICNGFAIGGEQPFLNYLTDTNGLNCERIDSLTLNIAEIIWARQSFTYDWRNDVARNPEGKVMTFIHWAGCAYPGMVRPNIFLRHRTSGLHWMYRIQYKIIFYFKRNLNIISSKKNQWKKVIIQFFTNKYWRKFYLYKLVGIKTELPK